MADLRTLVEREMDRAGSPSYSFVDLARRRDRKQRNRRIGTAVLALAVAAAAIGVAVRAFYRAEVPRPAELPNDTDDWSRVLLDPALLPEGHQGVSAITAGGPGLVAVGSRYGKAAVWTSSDGRTWTSVAGEELDGGEYIWDVTTGGPGLVAVGIGGDPTEVSVMDGIVWTSADGRAWEQAPHDPVFRLAWLQAVAAGGPGLVAVGTTPDGPQAWFSSDGVTWERASVPPVPRNIARDTSGLLHPRAEAYMRDVAVVGDRLVAVGEVGISCGEGCGRQIMIMWTSTDGMAWTEVSRDAVAFARGSSISSIAEGPEGLVAVGGEQYYAEPGVRISADGLTWRQVASGQDAFASRWPGHNLLLRSVAAASGGYVAVGGDGLCYSGGSCPPAEAAVWTSEDGETWARVPTGPVFQVGGTGWVSARVVSAWGSRFVAAGEYDGQEAIWISGPPGG